MKMNAFLRLIRTIACGVVVLGAANAAHGQVNDSNAVPGTLELVRNRGNQSADANAAGQNQAPVANDAMGKAQVYYPPGTEIPLRETEIPGSSYFVGPDGERIDSSTMMNQVPAGQEFEIPGKDSPQVLSPGQSFSAEGIYDGTLAFPMGTFPTTPFGERILSVVPAGDSETGESKFSEIEGALVDNDGKTVDEAAGDGATSGMENGVPIDQVVRPDNSPESDKKSVVDAGKSDSQTKVSKRQDRIKQRLKEALGEKEQLGSMLKKANQKVESLTKEVSKLKAGAAMKKSSHGKSAMALKNVSRDLKKSKAKLKETLGQLKDVEAEKKKLAKQMESAKKEANSDSEKKIKTLQKKMKSLLSSKEEAMEKAESAQKELADTKAQMAAKLADAEAAVVQAKKQAAEVAAKLEMSKAGNSAVAEKMAAGAVAGMAAMGGKMDKSSTAADAKMAADKAAVDAKMAAEAKAAADKAAADKAAADKAAADKAAADKAAADKAAADAKAAAELEVKRRLEMAEQAKKAAQEAEDAAAEKNKGKADGDEVLSLDDQIKRLKAKRDQQIAESETRIRAKQQREIDKLLEEGKAVDSDEVKSAVDKMKLSIKTSEEKLRSRFLRRLERLKEEMKDSLK